MKVSSNLIWKWGKLKGVIDGEFKEIEKPFQPYGYMVDNKHTRDIVSIEECIVDSYPVDMQTSDTKLPVLRFEVDKNSSMKELYEKYGKRHFYETDVPYIRRGFVDNIFESSFEGCVAFLDIETDDSKGFPVLSKAGMYKIVCVATYDQEGKGYWFDGTENEKQMFKDLVQWLKDNKKTIIVGWNVNFDITHLRGRAKALQLEEEADYLDCCCTIDIMQEYKGAIKGLSSYSLAEVSKHEKFGRIKGRDLMIHEMDKETLKDYNLYDTELLYLIDKRYHFTDIRIQIAGITNLTVDLVKSTNSIGDNLTLRRLHELGYVAPNVKDFIKRDYDGAVVFTPTVGMFSYALYVDVNHMYPSIIINENVDIEGFSGEVIPHTEKQLLQLRYKYQALFKETGEKQYKIKEKAVKIVANGLYGLFGMQFYRFCDYDKAEHITHTGRKVLEHIGRVAEERIGMQCKYGDTDSRVGDMGALLGTDDISEETAWKIGNEFAEIINKEIAPYTVKVEDILKKILFLQNDDGEPVKKRYIGMTFDGSYLMRGLELRRGDSSPLTKMVLQEVIDRIFKTDCTKDDLLKYLRDIKSELFTGKHDKNVIISKTMSKALNEYGNNAEIVRAYKKAQAKGEDFYDGRVKWVHVVGGDIEPITNEKKLEKIQLDYRTIYEKQVIKPAMRIINSAFKKKSVTSLDMFM